MISESEAFTLEDALPVIEQAMSPKTILVGGQAINLWAAILDVDIASPFLTRDIDFIGSQVDAIAADAKILRDHTLILATMDDSSINSATIEVTFPAENKSIVIDYLIRIHGVDRKDIDNSVIEMDVGTVVIRVIHPFHLMRSKISNLSIRQKQDSAGIAQAEASIAIFRAFLLEYMMQPEATSRSILNMIRKVIHFAKGSFAVDAYHAFNIEPLSAIPVAELAATKEGALQKFAKIGFNKDIIQVEKFRTK